MRRIAPDRLFAALDGRPLSLDGGHWHVRVLGVFDYQGQRWVQVELEGTRSTVVTLNLAPGHGPRHAARTLVHWLADPSTAPEVEGHYFPR